MIRVYLYTNPHGDIYAFKAYDHGEGIVCAAVSALSINCVNSIEALTDTHFTCDYDTTGGFLAFKYPAAKAGQASSDTALLLNSYRLGIEAIATDYKTELTVYLNDTPLFGS